MTDERESERTLVDGHLAVTVNETNNEVWITTHNVPWRGSLKEVRDFINSVNVVDDEEDSSSD